MKKSIASAGILFLPLFLMFSAQDRVDQVREKRIQWFRDAKFGLFVHWGVFAVPAGEWKGKVYSDSEWVMYYAQIPVREYEALAKEFNPTKFNADEWAKLARDAGMKYLVFTSKHHDGFAMYHSKASNYNIADATPFKRDPMKELSEACKKYGLKFCFYYSQTQDWHEKNGWGNDWDFDGESPKNFDEYYEGKVKPQVQELLTGYGPIGLIWFDTPRSMTAVQSKELVDLVHALQPECLINSRIGNELGDYKSKGDNGIPTGATDTDWETPASSNTLISVFGHHRRNPNFKPPKELVRALVEVAGKGGNYLLNVGPNAEGLIPEPSVERLRQVGKWLSVNGEAVYGTRMSPFTIAPEWGMITTKPGKLYLHVFDWPKNGKLELYGLRNKVARAYLLGNNTTLSHEQSEHEALGQHILSLLVPEEPLDTNATVIAVEVDGPLNVDNKVQQQPSQAITLYGIQANLQKGKGDSKIKKDDIGIVDWLRKDEAASWDFTLTKPGKFDIALGCFEGRAGSGRARRAYYEGGHSVVLSVADQEVQFTADREPQKIERPSAYIKDIVSQGGSVVISKPGMYTLTLKPVQLVTAEGNGLLLRWVRLTPSKGS